MAYKNDKYRNPALPMMVHEKSTLQFSPDLLVPLDRNPDAPPDMYKFESDVHRCRVYLPFLDFVVELDPLLNADPGEDLSEFVIQTSDEESEKEDAKAKTCTVDGAKNEDISSGEILSEEEPLKISPCSHSKKKQRHKRRKHRKKASSCSPRRNELGSKRSRDNSPPRRRRSNDNSVRKRRSRDSSLSRSSGGSLDKRIIAAGSPTRKRSTERYFHSRRRSSGSLPRRRRSRDSRSISPVSTASESSTHECPNNMKYKHGTISGKSSEPVKCGPENGPSVPPGRRGSRDSSFLRRRSSSLSKSSDGSADKRIISAESPRRKRSTERYFHARRRSSVSPPRGKRSREGRRSISPVSVSLIHGCPTNMKHKLGTISIKSEPVECGPSVSSEPLNCDSSAVVKSEPVESDHSSLKSTPTVYCPVKTEGDCKYRKIKDEVIEEPEHLHGAFICEVCHVSMNNPQMYEAHINGKKHLKVLKNKNIPDSVLKSVPKTEGRNRYPKPPEGVYRRVASKVSLIQGIVEEEVLTPCPGLDQVIEIRGLVETSYYCIICDSPCSYNNILPHLQGFKHQLRCLEHFMPPLYQKWLYQPKYKIEQCVQDSLREVERRKGRGRMIVEEEYYEQGSGGDVRRDINQPSTSGEGSSVRAHSPVDYNLPDISKSGFYCKLCESHMNSLPMWQSHIAGKRHAANVKKIPGCAPSKSRYVPVQGARPWLMDLLQDEAESGEPIVGLDLIREFQNPSINSATYQCLLCGGTITRSDIVPHLLSLKHRRKFLQHIQHPDLEVLGPSYSDYFAEQILRDICRKVQEEKGSGQPEVLISKSSFK